MHKRLDFVLKNRVGHGDGAKCGRIFKLRNPMGTEGLFEPGDSVAVESIVVTDGRWEVPVSVRPPAPAEPCAWEPNRPWSSGAVFSREPGLCDAHFSPVLRQETKPYRNEKETCLRPARSALGSVVPACGEAASAFRLRKRKSQSEWSGSLGRVARLEGEEPGKTEVGCISLPFLDDSEVSVQGSSTGKGLWKTKASRTGDGASKSAFVRIRRRRRN